MPNSGYPTPDNFEGDATFVCIPLIVPNKPEFKAAVYGLYGQMANVWFWKELGTMSPETAAWLSSLGLGATDAYGTCGDVMSCEDVADCFEEQIAIDPETNLPVNQEFYNTITNTINNSGFGNANKVNVYLTKVEDRNLPGAMDEPILPEWQCNLDKLWGGIRHGIVQRLDDSARDLLEDLALITDVAERAIVFVDTVPVLGDIAEGLLFNVSEVIPDILDLYNAYSSEETLDEIACEIFNMVCGECVFPSFQQIFEYYFTYGVAGTPSPANAVLNDIMEAVESTTGAIPKFAYHTIVYWELFVLNLQAVFNGLSGHDSILKMARLGEDFGSNNWQDLCDGCDEAYAYKIWDFTAEKGDTSKTLGFTGVVNNVGSYFPGKGWRLDKIASSTASGLAFALPFDPSWKVRAFGWRTSVARSTYGANITPQARPTPDSATSATTFAMGAGFNSFYDCKDGLLSITGFQQFALRLAIDPSQVAYLEKMIFIFDKGFSPSDAIPTADATACDWEY